MQGRQIHFPWIHDMRIHASTRSTLDIFGYQTSMLEPGPDTSRHIQTTIPVARLQRTPSENCSHQGSEYIRIVIVRICSSKISENIREPRFGPPGDCEVLRMVSDQDQPLFGDGALGRW